MMQRRALTKRLAVLMTVASAALCALSGSPWLAGAQCVAALALLQSRFGRPLEASAFEAVRATLRESYRRDTDPVEIHLATLCSGAMFMREPGAAYRWWHPVSVAFRDEVSTEQWRRVVTALRLQRPAAGHLSLNRNFRAV